MKLVPVFLLFLAKMASANLLQGCVEVITSVGEPTASIVLQDTMTSFGGFGLNPDGTRVVTTEKTFVSRNRYSWKLVIRDTETDQEKVVDLPDDTSKKNVQRKLKVAISPNGQWIANTIPDGTLQLRNADNPDEVQRTLGTPLTNAHASHVLFSDNAFELLVVMKALTIDDVNSLTDNVKIFETNTGTEVYSGTLVIRPHNALLQPFFPSSKKFAVRSHWGTIGGVWNAKTQSIDCFSMPDSQVLPFGPDNDLNLPDPVTRLAPFWLPIEFSPDNQFAAMQDSFGGRTRVIDLSQMKVILDLDKEERPSTPFFGGDNLVATYREHLVPTPSSILTHSVRLWDLYSGVVKKQVTLPRSNRFRDFVRASNGRLAVHLKGDTFPEQIILLDPEKQNSPEKIVGIQFDPSTNTLLLTTKDKNENQKTIQFPKK